MSLGASIQDVQNTFETALNSAGWQTLRRAVIPIAYPTSSLANYNNALQTSSGGGLAGGVYNVGSGIIGVQLSGNLTPTSMYITSGPDGSQAPNTFVLEYFSDGLGWTVLQTWTNEANWYSNEQRHYIITGAAAFTYWRLRIASPNSTILTLANWALEDNAGNRVANTNFIDIIPPAADELGPNLIGNSDAFEVLRLTFTGTNIYFTSLQYLKTSTPQVIALWEKTGGEVYGSLTLNGTTVNGATGLVGSTAKQNLRALYEAIRQDVDPSFTDWTWEYQTPSPQNADDGFDYIYGIKTVPSAFIPMSTNSNVYGGMVSGPCIVLSQPMPQPLNIFDASSTVLTIDLISGFVYYLSVCSRGIGLAIKTNTAFYGPIHACYANNAEMLTTIPNTGFGLKCNPIELLIGWDDVAANSGSGARTAHAWAVSNQTVRGIGNCNTNYPYEATCGTAFGFGRVRDKIHDYFFHSGYYQPGNVSLFGSGLFSGGSLVGNDYQIHRVNCVTETIGSGDTSITPIIPALNINDWYKFVGTATDEALLLVADTLVTSTATTILYPADIALTIASTTGFQSAGYIVIEGEIIQYTGLSGGNTFTGCTRGVYGTTATTHFIGDLVCQGMWFTKINGGALLCGYAKPV